MIKQAKDIRKVIQRRLDKWNEMQYDDLIDEAFRCDKNLKTKLKKRNIDEKELKETYFNRLVQRGKIKEASRFIDEEQNGGLLHPEDFLDVDSNVTVFDILAKKHPAASIPSPELLKLPENMKKIPKLESTEITAEHVEKAARRLHGNGGPGGSTSEQWADFLLRHGRKSALLRAAIATLTMKLNEEIVPWPKIQALMANRLVAINKRPGVRPIGIGEVLRRIMAKCIILASGEDVLQVCGTDQLCAGVKSGIEGAIHFMSDQFKEKSEVENDWCMIMVDADNAFNKINRTHALWQARLHWPRAARFIYNTYQSSCQLIIPGSTKQLYSQEGVTQGDPLSMLLYGLATMPLIEELKQISHTHQVWYADDSSCQGTFPNVLNWWKRLQEIGPAYGYHPQIQKTRLITISNLSEPNKIQIQGMKILNGSSFLGGFIGSKNEDKDIFLKEKIQKWTCHIDKLANVAKTHPQSAHTVATKSLQAQWTFLQRVVEAEEQYYTPLKDSIQSNLFPALFGSNLTTVEKDLLHLPIKYGGIGLTDPTTNIEIAFESSRNGCKLIVNSLKCKYKIDMEEHEQRLASAHKEGREKRMLKEKFKLQYSLEKLSEKQRKIILRAADPKAKHGNWLSCLPIKRLNLDLSPQEFRDGLALRYGKTPIQLPTLCDGCGQDFNTEHALSCRTGGLIIRRHNEVRDTLGDLMDMAWGNCVREPLISEQGSIDNPALKADLACRGVWEAQMEALFDVRVIDTDAPSYSKITHEQILENAEKEKRRKYHTATERRNASFTPLVTSVDGIVGKDFQTLLRALAERLNEKWQKPYSIIMNWVRVKTTCATLRATSMCLRRTRRKWRSAREFDDGAGVPYLF